MPFNAKMFGWVFLFLFSLQGKGQEEPFDSVKEKVFAPRCISCHSQYGDYQSVLREKSAIKSAVEEGRMPKRGGPLSAEQKELLLRWIAGQPEPKPVVLEPNWQSVSENIFIPKCQVCHNPQGSAKFLDLSSRQAIYERRDEVFGAYKLIDIDSPANSYLMQLIKDSEEPMPPTWSNIPRLNENEISVLEIWIGKGLP